MKACLKSFVRLAWTPEHSRRSCLTIFCCQILLLFSLLAIAFVYCHVYLPNYNAKRLSKYPLVCSTVENELVGAEHCELPWDHDHITVERSDKARRLYENDAHSATLSLQKVAVPRSESVENGSYQRNAIMELREVATERHFTWSSCGEFCSPDLVDKWGCHQIRVKVRRLGSELSLKGCTDLEVMDCPFLDNSEAKTTLATTSCSTAEDKSCLRLGIFKCGKPARQNINSSSSDKLAAQVVAPTNFSTSTTETTTLANTYINGTGLVNESESNLTTFSTSPTTSTPSTITTTTTTLGSSTASQKPSMNISKLEEELECSHIEKLISCNMSKLDKDESLSGYSSIARYNCTIPSSDKCFKVPGTYICDSESICRKIQNPDKICTRTCEGIGMDDKNVVIADEQFRKILTAKCTKAYRHNGNHMEVWPAGIKHKTHPKWRATPQILITCNRVDWTKLMKKNATGESDEMDFIVKDCFNGTRLENTTLPSSATLRELQSLWTLNLETEDYDLDPIERVDAPHINNLTVQTSSPLYLNDFYKNMGEGCSQISNPEEEGGKSFDLEKCTNFYTKYGHLPGELKGQSVFPCYCRSLSEGGFEDGGNSTLFCVVGDMKGVQVFESHWEDGLVEFLQDYYIPVLILLLVLLLSSLTLICLLLYPLVADLTPVNNLVLVGVSPNPSLRHSPRSGRSVKFMEDKRSTVFTVGGVPKKDEIQMELRRSRSNSIVSVM